MIRNSSNESNYLQSDSAATESTDATAPTTGSNEIDIDEENGDQHEEQDDNNNHHPKNGLKNIEGNTKRNTDRAEQEFLDDWTSFIQRRQELTSEHSNLTKTKNDLPNARNAVRAVVARLGLEQENHNRLQAELERSRAELDRLQDEAERIMLDEQDMVRLHDELDKKVKKTHAELKRRYEELIKVDFI